MYLQVGDVLPLHEQGIPDRVGAILGEATHCKDEVGVHAEVDISVGIKEGGPRGRGEHPVGANKGQQDGRRSTMNATATESQ